MSSHSSSREAATVTNRASELAVLTREVHALQDTTRALASRLERTLTALALTLDAQAATRLRLAHISRDEARLRESVEELQAAAERYRVVARQLFGDQQR